VDVSLQRIATSRVRPSRLTRVTQERNSFLLCAARSLARSPPTHCNIAGSTVASDAGHPGAEASLLFALRRSLARSLAYASGLGSVLVWQTGTEYPDRVGSAVWLHGHMAPVSRYPGTPLPERIARRTLLHSARRSGSQNAWLLCPTPRPGVDRVMRRIRPLRSPSMVSVSYPLSALPSLGCAGLVPCMCVVISQRGDRSACMRVTTFLRLRGVRHPSSNGCSQHEERAACHRM
jgi:hypothetical protein